MSSAAAVAQKRYRQSEKGRERKKRWKQTAKGRSASRKAHKLRGERLKALVRELKSIPCADCGGTFDPVCMDFDHREPGTKNAGVASLVGRRQAVAAMAEIAKCDVVCANCHRLRTYRLRDHRERCGMKPEVNAQIAISFSEDNE